MNRPAANTHGFVGIVVATRAELRALPSGSVLGVSGVRAVLCGMGPERAHAAGAKMIEEGAAALVSWGSAAGCDMRLHPGDLLLPREVTGAAGGRVNVDAAWHARLFERVPAGIRIHTEPLGYTRTLLSHAREKEAFRVRTGLVAADMESGVLADLAARAGLPFLAVRAVADPAWSDLPHGLMRAISPYGEVRPLALIVFAYPSAAARFGRLARHIRTACATLRALARASEPRLEAAYMRAPEGYGNGASVERERSAQP